MDNLENIDVSNMDVSTMSKVIERLWPKFLDAGMNIVWAVLILIVGLKLISILRKFLKKTLLRGNVDTGVVQFLDALVNSRSRDIAGSGYFKERNARIIGDQLQYLLV